MAKVYHTETFKHGNGVAIRFPKEWGIKVRQLFEVTRRGETVVFRFIDEEVTPPPSAALQ